MTEGGKQDAKPEKGLLESLVKIMHNYQIIERLYMGTPSIQTINLQFYSSML